MNTGKRKSVKPREKTIHFEVCKYIRSAYPGVVFFSDPSGLRLSMGMRMQIKRIKCEARGLPDLWIMQPKVRDCKVVCGLAIELKRSVSGYRKKDGMMPRDPDGHLHEQAQMITALNRKGYSSCFCGGFTEAIMVIDRYMKLPDYRPS